MTRKAENRYQENYLCRFVSHCMLNGCGRKIPRPLTCQVRNSDRVEGGSPSYARRRAASISNYNQKQNLDSL